MRIIFDSDSNTACENNDDLYSMPGSEGFMHSSVVNGRRCLTESLVAEYNKCVDAAARAEWSLNWELAASFYLKAMNICDDSLSLHRKLAYISIVKLNILEH